MSDLGDCVAVRRTEGAEVDGDIHDLQQAEDAQREKALREMGLQIIRFRNDEIEKNLSHVVAKIREFVI